jgi:hypothetical protein
MYTRNIQGKRMSVAMNDWIPRHRITVDEYYRMDEVGILPPDARVELIEGEIIDMAPIGSGHGGTVLYADITSTDAPGVVAPAALPEVQIDLTHVLDD